MTEVVKVAMLLTSILVVADILLVIVHIENIRLKDRLQSLESSHCQNAVDKKEDSHDACNL